MTKEFKTIQERRIEMGLSQEELAKMLYVSVDTLRSWEQGKRKPTHSKLIYDTLDNLAVKLARLNQEKTAEQLND